MQTWNPGDFNVLSTVLPYRRLGRRTGLNAYSDPDRRDLTDVAHRTTVRPKIAWYEERDAKSCASAQVYLNLGMPEDRAQGRHISTSLNGGTARALVYVASRYVSVTVDVRFHYEVCDRYAQN